MAAFLSNRCILAPPLRLSSKTHKTLISQTQSFRLSNPTIKPFYSSPLRNRNFVKRPSFGTCYSAQHSASTTKDGEENHENDVKASENEADVKTMVNLENLMNAYKVAILTGDEKIVADIEARMKDFERQNNELVQKVSVFSAEIASGKDKYIRLQADFDNYRKRSEKERFTIRTDALGEVIESLLPMVDNFERAKQQIKPETEKEKKIDTSYQGIYKQFVEIMRSLQVAVVATVGKPFDPSLHEAIAREESQEYKEGIITQEFRRGFLLGDRLIRPAMVKVSSGPGKMKAAVNAEQPATAAGVDDR